MKKNVITNTKGNCSTMKLTTGHRVNVHAYDIYDERICKVNGEEKNYHFCSPVYTDNSDCNITSNMEYLGMGKIIKIKGEPYNSADKNDSLHFWKVVDISTDFLNIQ